MTLMTFKKDSGSIGNSIRAVKSRIVAISSHTTGSGARATSSMKEKGSKKGILSRSKNRHNPTELKTIRSKSSSRYNTGEDAITATLEKYNREKHHTGIRRSFPKSRSATNLKSDQCNCVDLKGIRSESPLRYDAGASATTASLVKNKGIKQPSKSSKNSSRYKANAGLRTNKCNSAKLKSIRSKSPSCETPRYDKGVAAITTSPDNFMKSKHKDNSQSFTKYRTTTDLKSHPHNQVEIKSIRSERPLRYGVGADATATSLNKFCRVKHTGLSRQSVTQSPTKFRNSTDQKKAGRQKTDRINKADSIAREIRKTVSSSQTQKKSFLPFYPDIKQERPETRNPAATHNRNPPRASEMVNRSTFSDQHRENFNGLQHDGLDFYKQIRRNKLKKPMTTHSSHDDINLCNYDDEEEHHDDNESNVDSSVDEEDDAFSDASSVSISTAYIELDNKQESFSSISMSQQSSNNCSSHTLSTMTESGIKATTKPFGKATCHPITQEKNGIQVEVQRSCRNNPGSFTVVVNRQ